jgi:hypothetical protein
MKQTAVFSSTINLRTRRRINKINYLSLRRYCKGLGFEDARIPSGAYSVYFRKGSIGVKVLRTCSRGQWGVGGYKSPKRVRMSVAWQDAVEEFAALRIADWTGHTPIPYCVKVVQLGKKYYPAIFMEHIKGVPLGSFVYSHQMSVREENHIYQGLDEMEKLLQHKCGIDHSLDSGGNNAIVVKHQGRKIQAIKLIDFSPGLIEIGRNTLEEALEDIPELWHHNLFGWRYSPVRGMTYCGRRSRLELI